MGVVVKIAKSQIEVIDRCHQKREPGSRRFFMPDARLGAHTGFYVSLLDPPVVGDREHSRHTVSQHIGEVLVRLVGYHLPGLRARSSR